MAHFCWMKDLIDDIVVVRDDKTDASSAPCKGWTASDMSTVQDTLELSFFIFVHLGFISYFLTKVIFFFLHR